MKPLHTVETEPIRVFLAEIRSGADTEPLTAELRGLTNTLGLNIVGSETVVIRDRKGFFPGSGKLKELSEKALSAGAQCIIFDSELSPSQQRKWEALCGLSVLDRQELIIRIFASRAKTREAGLQAELAELLYALPRLSHKYIDLSRQRGGRYGTRGSGETQLETDRRQIRERIGSLRKEIEDVRTNRMLQRKQRKKQGIAVCALVGYTNAGKSSLHRALTGSEALVENKLFATLDPTARRVYRQSPSGKGKTIIFVDTVGFIRRLPHNLVDAFKSTLEEVCQADILIHVLDASDPSWKEHSGTVQGQLKELGAENIPLITVLNKADLLTTEELIALETAVSREIPAFSSAITAVSAKNKEGLEPLWKLIEKRLKF
ncbi:MAG: GTPase HflX [Treponema sp.]|nr:GTPase HflX [Treponema sp.]